MDFVKKGMVSHKYLADGCEFKKVKESYKLVSTQNDKYQPFIGKVLVESIWDLISNSTVTSGSKYNEFYGLLLDHFKSGKTIFSKDANILLKNGEEVVFQSPNNIVLKEPKSIRVTKSAHSGVGHRHGKNSFGYGTSRTVGESKEVVKVVDSGQIIITNKRFIYTGNNRNIDVNISQIVGITPYSDGFKLQRKGKQKPEYFINIDGYAFNYNFNNETYFFFMNGQIIKSLIEGGLNKTPKISKLEQLASQKQIDSKIETIKVKINDFEFEYKSDWKQIDNKQKSHIFTIEKINGAYRSQIHLSNANIPKDEISFENKIKDLIIKEGFEITEFEHIERNGIDMLSVGSKKDVKNTTVEMNVNYFDSSEYRFSIFLTNNELDDNAKRDYANILNSIKFIKSEERKSKMNFCPNCGNPIDGEGNFCTNCGEKL